MTSVDSSKDRIIIPDQAQRRSNLDEVKVQRDAWSRPSGTRIFRSLDTHTYIYRRVVGVQVVQVGWWEMTSWRCIPPRGGSRSRGRSGGGG